MQKKIVIKKIRTKFNIKIKCLWKNQMKLNVWGWNCKKTNLLR